MPNYLYAKLSVHTFEMECTSEAEADARLKHWNELHAKGEKLPDNIKATTYRLAWQEFNEPDPTEKRNQVLASFLNLMQNQIPGIPVKEKSLIVLPYPGIKLEEEPQPPPSAA